MNNIIWITVREACTILDCTRSNVHHLIQMGNLRRQERAKDKRLVYIRHSDCVDYRASSAWRACKGRNTRPDRRGMRDEKDQPVLDKDIAKLVKNWKGSKEQKAYNKRYIRRAGNDNG